MRLGVSVIISKTEKKSENEFQTGHFEQKGTLTKYETDTHG